MDVAVKAQPSWPRGLSGRSLAAQQGSQQKHSGHRRPGQEPFVEGLLAFSHLGSSIVPIEVHKALLWEEESGEHRGVSGAEGRAGRKAVVGTGQMTDALCFLALNHAQRARGEAQS